MTSIIPGFIKKRVLRIIEKSVEEHDKRMEARFAELAANLEHLANSLEENDRRAQGWMKDLLVKLESIPYTLELHEMLSLSSSRVPHKLFKDVGDDFWLWVNTEGYRVSSALKDILPGLPPEYFQLAVAGLTGDETLKHAFGVYRLLRRLIEEHYKPVSECSAILDFGCGWGRITRFFIKDIDGSHLWGIDHWEKMVKLATQTNPWCHFSHVDQHPPTDFPDHMFDVVFSFSVFSHIGEDTQKHWIAEFDRIMKPGGLILATTHRREQIEFLECVRRGEASLWDDHYKRAIAERFTGAEKALADYDSGRFFHIDLGYPGNPDYGETCIPKEYILKEWTRFFDLLDFINDRARCEQNVIVARKPAIPARVSVTHK